MLREEDLTVKLLNREACGVRMEKGDDEYGKHDNCLPDSVKRRVRMNRCLLDQALHVTPNTLFLYVCTIPLTRLTANE